ncbi:MAG: hypothetical protein WD276_06025 [Actinomycetota bacterium]
MTVKDEAGAVVGTASLGRGSLDKTGAEDTLGLGVQIDQYDCVFAFKAPVEKAKFYSVDVAGAVADPQPVSAAELDASGWKKEFMLGS